jgi:hypothetical protein
VLQAKAAVGTYVKPPESEFVKLGLSSFVAMLTLGLELVPSTEHVTAALMLSLDITRDAHAQLVGVTLFIVKVVIAESKVATIMNLPLSPADACTKAEVEEVISVKTVVGSQLADKA